MKTIPEGMRPYERLEKYGESALSDAELLAVIIKSGTSKKTALAVAGELLTKYGGVTGIGAASIAELMSISGIGHVKAIQIKALSELGLRIANVKYSSRIKVTDYDCLCDLLTADMKGQRQEIFEALFFDKKWNYISKCKISLGTVDKALAHPREVFYHAIKNLASAVVLAHNHPSGDCMPSKADFDTTVRMIDAGRLIGIEVIDHIIVGGESFYSMHLKGDMRKMKENCVNERSKKYGT